MGSSNSTSGCTYNSDCAYTSVCNMDAFQCTNCKDRSVGACNLPCIVNQDHKGRKYCVAPLCESSCQIGIRRGNEHNKKMCNLYSCAGCDACDDPGLEIRDRCRRLPCRG